MEVCCTCRLPWVKAVNVYGDLAQCGKCKGLFHQKCMDSPIAAFVEQSYGFVRFVLSVHLDLVNPRRACAARVTVLGLSVCVCVCVSMTILAV